MQYNFGSRDVHRKFISRIARKCSGKRALHRFVDWVCLWIFCGLAVYLLNHFEIHNAGGDSLAIGTTISMGLFGACLVATALGSFSPFFFARFGIDPAVASGPIVTAFNDVLSTLMFFLIARALYPIFA